MENEIKLQEKANEKKLDLFMKLEDIRRKELLKTQSLYEKMDVAIEGLYSDVYNTSVFGKKQAEDIDKFESSLKEVAAVLNKDTAETYELINAQKKLSALQGNVSSYVQNINQQKNAQEKLQELQVQREIKTIRLQSQYGDLFDEEEFRRVYSLTEDIRKELESGEPSLEKINSWFKQMNSNAKLFETNLSIANKELKKAQRETEILNSSLGRFIQFYGFGELFRGIKTGVDEIKSYKSKDMCNLCIFTLFCFKQIFKSNDYVIKIIAVIFNYR